MLYIPTEYILIIYIQFIIGSKEHLHLLKRNRLENDSEHFVPDSIFKRLNFDYSSSETVSNQRIKLSAILVTVCS